MLITCWSSKGGSGTTVVAAALAALLAAEHGAARLVDLGGDLPAALGLPEPVGGLTGWDHHEGRPEGALPAAQPTGRFDLAGRRCLAALEVDGRGGVRLVPRGAGVLSGGLGPPLAGALADGPSAVVDAGVIGPEGADPGLELAARATASLLVMRPCFLALRRAVAAPLRATGVVLVDEPQRVLGRADVEAALGIPVVAVVPWDPAIARRVDAGLLGASLPPALARALRRAMRTCGSGGELAALLAGSADRTAPAGPGRSA